MAYRLEASGARRITATTADDDGLVSPAVIPSDSSVVFEAYTAMADIVLSTDAPVPINFGPAIGADVNYLVVRVKGGRVNVTLASTLDGSAVLPVEPRLELRTDNLALTGLILQRPVGVEVVVSVYMGRRSD